MIKTDTLKNGYKILQDTERFQFGIDAVLLANFASRSLRNGESVIDLGTGTGIIPLLMCPAAAADFVALEVQAESAALAEKSVAMNGLEGRIQIVNGDLKEVDKYFARHSFNLVTCNPPYMIGAHGAANELDAKTIARHEVLCTLEDVVAASDYLLAPHGRFFMIHRPFRLPEIFSSLEKHKMEMKCMRLIMPFAGKEPNMVMIEARKNAKRRLTIEPPLIVRNDDGNYTDEINIIYGVIK